MARGRGGLVSGSGVEARIDPAQWAQFLRDLRQLAPEVRKQLTKELKTFLGPLADAAKQNAAWSTRIPGAIAKTVAGRRLGLRVRSAKAPHARPYEGMSGATFRHPVFGNRSVWVSQQARPFLKPAVESHRDEFMEAAGKAVDEAAQQTGWK